MQQSWSPATLSKKDSNTSIFLWIFRTFYRLLFYRTTPVAAFELSFSIRKEFKKKKASGEIDCLCFNWLVSCTNIRTCKQVNYHLSLNFIITKYLKQEVGDDLSVSADELGPYGLSVTGDIKIYQCHVIKW